jgi:methyl-accepting chemotaxis protein
MLFKKMKFGAKLISGFIVVSLILLAVGVIGIMSTQKVGKVADQILEEEVPLTDAVMEMKYELVLARDLMGEYLIETNLEELPKIREEFEASAKRFDDWSEAIISGGTVEGIQVVATDNAEIVKMVEHVQEDHALFEENATEMMEHHRNSLGMQDVVLTQDDIEAREHMEALDEASAVAIEDLAKAEVKVGEEMHSAMERADNTQYQTFMIILVTSALAFVFSLMFGVFISRGAIKAFRRVSDVATELASSSEELSATAQQVAEGSQSQASTLEETSASVEELAASVEQVSDHAQSQTAAVEESTSSMDQIQSSIEQVSKSLEEVSSTTGEALDRAQDGAESVRQVIDVIKSISESSEKIAGIVNVISDIADQTNLLALNASIEAARAGEHGRGFAVVADEVSKLADRSAGSTKEIEALIKESERVVKNGVELAEKSGESMEVIIAGSKKSSETVLGLTSAIEQQISGIKELSKAIESINEMSQSISAATEEQSTNSKQVSKAVENVNALTQQAASAAEEMSASAEQLSSMAQELEVMMARFIKINEERSRHVQQHKVLLQDKSAVRKSGRMIDRSGGQEVTDITLKDERAA